MKKTSVKIVDPKIEPKTLEEVHMSAEHIARSEIAPALMKIINKNRMSRTQLAGSMISIAYALLRKDHEPKRANALFRDMANKSQSLFNFKRDHKVQ